MHLIQIGGNIVNLDNLVWARRGGDLVLSFVHRGADAATILTVPDALADSVWQYLQAKAQFVAEGESEA